MFKCFRIVSEGCNNVLPLNPAQTLTMKGLQVASRLRIAAARAYPSKLSGQFDVV